MILIVVLCSSIILCILLLLYIHYKHKSIEHYDNISEHILKKIDNTSTVIYSKKENSTDAAFNKAYKNSVINSNEFMIMNRCIELNKGAFDKICDMKISYGKIIIPYTTFSDIQTVILNTLRRIYTDKDAKYINTVSGIIKGPVYVLITQYPFLKTVDSNCNVSTTILNSYNEARTEEIYKPYNIKNSTKNDCDSTIINLQKNYKIECELCLLFPYINPSESVSLEDIAENREFLSNSDLIINPRSQGNQCFVKCGLISPDGYACGAKNSGDNNPYESIVASSLINNKDKKIFSDFANLYAINPQIINNYVGIKIIEDEINEEPSFTVPPTVITPRITRYNGYLNFSDTNIIQVNSDRDVMNTAVSSITSLLAQIESIAKNVSTTINNIASQKDYKTHLEKLIKRPRNLTTTGSYNKALEEYKKIEEYKTNSISSKSSISTQITDAKDKYQKILENSKIIEGTFSTEAYVLLSSIKTQADNYIKSIENANAKASELSKNAIDTEIVARKYIYSLKRIIDSENTVIKQYNNIKKVNTDIRQLLQSKDKNRNNIIKYKLQLGSAAFGISKKNKELSNTANAISYHNKAKKIMTDLYPTIKTPPKTPTATPPKTAPPIQKKLPNGYKCWELGRSGDGGNPKDKCSKCENGYSAYDNYAGARYCGPIPSGKKCKIEGRSNCDRSYNNGCNKCSKGMGKQWFNGQCDAKCA